MEGEGAFCLVVKTTTPHNFFATELYKIAKWSSCFKKKLPNFPCDGDYNISELPDNKYTCARILKGLEGKGCRLGGHSNGICSSPTHPECLDLNYPGETQWDEAALARHTPSCTAEY